MLQVCKKHIHDNMLNQHESTEHLSNFQDIKTSETKSSHDATGSSSGNGKLSSRCSGCRCSSAASSSGGDSGRRAVNSARAARAWAEGPSRLEAMRLVTCEVRMPEFGKMGFMDVQLRMQEFRKELLDIVGSAFAALSDTRHTTIPQHSSSTVPG